ncbi:MAG: sugar transferase [Cyanobacteria bacterium]|uniref:sugar transferase n=1 Tax=Geminocystis sp. TaxID=2664100 RepID=UPI001D56D6DF|nr:sugar transferase [Cyanobacteria bacterium CG_2015-16_32_12]NCO78437.1 sugar transferase [Cyanobacteria bacterium CG_2015-22_32_23]NCQ04824.1 sugar transferase [Cyanobacteria bacterium CG_2015-09_32_10]NCQ42062.1 sugar transferase [Cyanobacteria bacterium CG_2015-04_32_10]NCS84252.1 sugar transferase [Cyanobacteria bacterium CG_2015-02_32_10]
MTANSQLVSVKVMESLARRGLISFSRQPNKQKIRITRQFYKRTFDIVFSASVLVLFSPLYVILSLLIAISSPGPIFYQQERVGKNFKHFKCLKFRTMIVNADQVLEDMLAKCPEKRQEFEDNFKLKNDPRITWIGKFLRITSLDEFPQFLNVLKGDMSVIGPRPLVPDELHKYGNKMDRVLTIKPGITGLWQVSGRNDIPYPQRVLIDVYYVNHHNWFLDIWIILKTIGVVIFPENNGAY